MSEENYTYSGREEYCYPGTDVLKNKLGIRDDNALTTAEKEITSIKLLMLYNAPVADRYDFSTLCKIHKTIFEDIYEWAGQIRKSDFFSKGNSIFCRGIYIVENSNNVIGNLLKEKYLCGLDKPQFVKRMAYYMGEINALHPFREGNGRTCREFFRQLSISAGYTLDFSKTEKNELFTADIEAFNGRYERLINVLENAVS